MANKKDIEKTLSMIRTLLEQGRGFDFQSHGNRNGSNFYNFALYPVHWNKGKTTYMNSDRLDVIVESLQFFMVVGKVDVGEPLEKPEEEEEESMEDLL